MIEAKSNALKKWLTRSFPVSYTHLRVTNDVDLMTQSFNQSLVQMVSSIVLLMGSIFMMFKTDWHLALTAILSVFGGFALSCLLYTSRCV